MMDTNGLSRIIGKLAADYRPSTKQLVIRDASVDAALLSLKFMLLHLNCSCPHYFWPINLYTILSYASMSKNGFTEACNLISQKKSQFIMNTCYRVSLKPTVGLQKCPTHLRFKFHLRQNSSSRCSMLVMLETSDTKISRDTREQIKSSFGKCNLEHNLATE